MNTYKELENVNKPYMMKDGLHALSKEHKHSLAEILTEEQEELLRDVHAENYMGTDDDMTESYERWLMNLKEDEIINIIGHAE